MDRRTFLKVTGAQAGMLAAAPAALGARLEAAEPPVAAGAPALSRRSPHVVVIGAGAWGGWTAYWLRVHGAQVTLVDAYGPGNSRASSGDDTRGIRTAYGDRELWSRMGAEAIRRWNTFDAEWARPLNQRHFFTTGDLILRAEFDTFLTETRAVWDRIDTPYEVLTPDEIRYRYPQIEIGDLGVGVYEPWAGVARARRCCESVAEIVQRMGGELRIAHASPGARSGSRMHDVVLAPGDRLAADAFVFACGVWLPKVVPEAMAGKMRASLGHVYYFGTPPGEHRFTFPNMPSWNVGGTTGWPALGVDNRGFRVRFGGRPGDDPDTSDRAIDLALHTGARDFLQRWFPAMGEAPVLETRACHYDGSINRNFIVDHHPGLDNVWIVGAGQAEGFKMGPVIGEYAARRVLGLETEPQLAEEFALPRERYEP